MGCCQSDVGPPPRGATNRAAKPLPRPKGGGAAAPAAATTTSSSAAPAAETSAADREPASQPVEKPRPQQDGSTAAGANTTTAAATTASASASATTGSSSTTASASSSSAPVKQLPPPSGGDAASPAPTQQPQSHPAPPPKASKRQSGKPDRRDPGGEAGPDGVSSSTPVSTQKLRPRQPTETLSPTARKASGAKESKPTPPPRKGVVNAGGDAPGGRAGERGEGGGGRASGSPDAPVRTPSGSQGGNTVSSSGGASSSSSSHQQLETVERASNERGQFSGRRTTPVAAGAAQQRGANGAGGGGNNHSSNNNTNTSSTDDPPRGHPGAKKDVVVNGASAASIPPPVLSPMKPGQPAAAPDAVTPVAQVLPAGGGGRLGGVSGNPAGGWSAQKGVNPILTGLQSRKGGNEGRLSFDPEITAAEGGRLLKNSERANAPMGRKAMEFSANMARQQHQGESDDNMEQDTDSGHAARGVHANGDHRFSQPNTASCYSPHRGQSEGSTDDCPQRLRHLPSMLRREDSFLQDDIYGENINYRSSLAAHTGYEGRLFCSLRTSGLIPPPALREEEPPEAPRMSASAPHHSARACMLFGIALNGGDLMGASIPASRLRAALSPGAEVEGSAAGRHNPRPSVDVAEKNKLLKQSGWPQSDGHVLVDLLLASTRFFSKEAGGKGSPVSDGDPLISQAAVQHFAQCRELFGLIDLPRSGKFTAWELATALRDQAAVQSELSIPPYLATPLFRQIVPGKPYATLVSWYTYFHDKHLKFASQPVQSFREVLSRLLPPPYSFSEEGYDPDARVSSEAVVAKFKADRYLQLELGWPDPEASLSALGKDPRREDVERVLKLRWAWTRADASHDGFIGPCELGDALEEVDVAACLNRSVGDVKAIWRELDTSGTGVTMWYDFFKFFSDKRNNAAPGHASGAKPKRRANAELQRDFNLDLLKSNVRIEVSQEDTALLNSTLNKKRRHTLALQAIAASVALLPVCSEAASSRAPRGTPPSTPRRRVTVHSTPEIHEGDTGDSGSDATGHPNGEDGDPDVEVPEPSRVVPQPIPRESEGDGLHQRVKGHTPRNPPPHAPTRREERGGAPLQGRQKKEVPQAAPAPAPAAPTNNRENHRETREEREKRREHEREKREKERAERAERRQVRSQSTPSSRPSRPRGNSGAGRGGVLGSPRNSAPSATQDSQTHGKPRRVSAQGHAPPQQRVSQTYARPSHADPCLFQCNDTNSPPQPAEGDPTGLVVPGASTFQQQYAEAPTPKFPELMHPGDRYNTIKKLGEGNFGVVYLVERKSDGLLLVTKEPKRPSGSMTPQKRAADARRMRKVQKEAAHLMRLRHPNILRFIEAYWENGALVIVTEYCDGGDLAAWLTRYRSTAAVACKWNIFEQISAALSYMHERGVMHRDLKPANILLTSRSIVKVADFGLARALRPEEEVAHTICGTELYMAPEVHNRTPYGRAADVFALGCILYQMVKGRKPFVNLMELLECKPPQDAPKYAAKLIRDMLQVDHTLRPSMSQVLRRCPDYRPRRKQGILFLLWWRRRAEQMGAEWPVDSLAIRVLSFHMIIAY